MASEPETRFASDRRSPLVKSDGGGCFPVLAIIGSLTAGFLGLAFGLAGFIAAFENRRENQILAVAGGLALVGSALAFGLLANALWRK
jgi:hypothetical protein